MIIADKSYEVVRSHHRFPDRRAEGLRRRHLRDLGRAEGRGAGDPQSGELGWKPVYFLGNVSTSVATVLKPAGLENSKGIISTAYIKDPTDPTWKDDPGIKAWRAFMDKYFPEGDKTNNNNVYGYATAQTMVQVLKQCGDDLTRENVMRQAASLKDFTSRRAAARHQDQHQPERLLSDRADAADALQRRELGTVRRDHRRRSRALRSGGTVDQCLLR